jgi:AcrR family transcriptional regulator
MTQSDADRGRADALRNRAAILQAAAEVLAATPGASLSEVAQRAGLGRATLYRHFESREALVRAIREEALVQAAAALDQVELSRCSVRDGVCAAASVLVPLGLRFQILLVEQADADPDFRAARDEVLAPLRELVARGVASGELDRSVDPRWVAMVLAGLLTSAVRAAVTGVIDPASAGDVVSDALLDGVRGDKRGHTPHAG